MQPSRKDLLTPWQVLWAEGQQFERQDCKAERARRQRVIGCEAWGGLGDADAQKLVQSERYAESLLIIEYNQPL